MLPSINFGGISSTDDKFGILSVTKVERDALSGTNDNLMQVMGRDGVFDFGYNRDPIEIKVTFFVNGSSKEDFHSKIRNISGWLNVDKVDKLVISEEPDLYYIARPVGTVPLNKENNSAEIQVTFLSPEPFAYSVEEHEVFVIGSSTDLAEINVKGTYETPFTINYRAFVTNALETDYLEYKNEDTGEFLRMNKKFYPNDRLFIDTDKRIITQNGVDIRWSLDPNSTYFKLKAGENNIRLSPESIATTSTFRYNERWI